MRNIFQTAGVKVRKLETHGVIKMLVPRGRERERNIYHVKTVISALRSNNRVSSSLLKHDP